MSPTPSTAPTACASPPPATGPDVAFSLDESSDGGTYCLAASARMSVFLRAPDAGAAGSWSAIEVSDAAVLVHVPSGALTLARGVTAGIFAVGRAGTTVLSSTLSCPVPAPAGCVPGKRWQVTVVAGG